MSKALLGIFALTLIGCVDQTPPPPTVCTNIELDFSTRLWGVTLDCESPTIEVRRSGVADVERECEENEKCLGSAPIGGYSRERWEWHVYVKPFQCDERILAHELGHLFGLEHVDDPTDIMYPFTTKEECAEWPASKENYFE